MKYNKHEIHLTGEEVKKLTTLRKKNNTSKASRIRCQSIIAKDIGIPIVLQRFSNSECVLLSISNVKSAFLMK